MATGDEMKIKHYLHDDSGNAVEVANQAAVQLGFEEYGREYDAIYQLLFCKEIEFEFELDPDTLKGRLEFIRTPQGVFRKSSGSILRINRVSEKSKPLHILVYVAAIVTLLLFLVCFFIRH